MVGPPGWPTLVCCRVGASNVATGGSSVRIRGGKESTWNNGYTNATPTSAACNVNDAIAVQRRTGLPWDTARSENMASSPAHKFPTIVAGSKDTGSIRVRRQE